MLSHVSSKCALLFAESILPLAACFFLITSHWQDEQKQCNSTFATTTSSELVWKLCRQREMKTYSAVSLLRSRCLPREQDEFGAVLLQTLHIGLERLCGLVTATGVNWDANCAGCLFVDASCLQAQKFTLQLKKKKIQPRSDMFTIHGEQSSE